MRERALQRGKARKMVPVPLFSELSDLTLELDRAGDRFEAMDARSRRDFLRLAALVSAGFALRCSGGGSGGGNTPTDPNQPVTVTRKLKSSRDGSTGVVGTSIEYTDVNGGRQTTGTASDGSYSFQARAGSTYEIAAGNYERRSNVPLDYKHAGDTIFMVPTDDRALYDRVKDVFFIPSGMQRMPSNHFGESQPMWRIQLDPKLPDSYKDVIMQYVNRSFEFTDGGVNLAGAPVESLGNPTTLEDGVLKWVINNSIPGDGSTGSLLSGNNTLRGAVTSLRTGFSLNRQKQVIGHEIIRQYGGVGISPNGGLMVSSAENEDFRDVPMVRIAYRTETGHRPA